MAEAYQEIDHNPLCKEGANKDVWAQQKVHLWLLWSNRVVPNAQNCHNMLILDTYN